MWSPFSTSLPHPPQPRCHNPHKVNSATNTADLHNHKQFQEYPTFEVLLAVRVKGRVKVKVKVRVKVKVKVRVKVKVKVKVRVKVKVKDPRTGYEGPEQG